MLLSGMSSYMADTVTTDVSHVFVSRTMSVR